MIDFRRNKDDITAKVERLEYDPNRSANIALVLYADGERKYIIAPNGLQVGANYLKFNSVNFQDFRWRGQCTFIILFIYTEHVFI